MRKKTISRDSIIDATILIVALDGIENVTMRKISSECGISVGSMFNYFENKENLLVESLYHIDNQINDEMVAVTIDDNNVRKGIRKLWYRYFNFLIAHPDYVKYYRAIRHSAYFTEEVVAGQDKSLSFFLSFIKRYSNEFKEDAQTFWVYVVEITLSFAVRVVDGHLPGTDADIERYFHLIAYGMEGVFCNIDTEWKD